MTPSRSETKRIVWDAAWKSTAQWVVIAKKPPAAIASRCQPTTAGTGSISARVALGPTQSHPIRDAEIPCDSLSLCGWPLFDSARTGLVLRPVWLQCDNPDATVSLVLAALRRRGRILS